MSEPYRPRDHDHLVEPMFGGLGVKDSAAPGPRPGFWRRLWKALVRLVRPSRPASGR